MGDYSNLSLRKRQTGEKLKMETKKGERQVVIIKKERENMRNKKKMKSVEKDGSNLMNSCSSSSPSPS